MILRKSNEGEDILGLKVIGGQILSNGRIGAIIEKVKRGSIADQEGHIRPGNLNNYTLTETVNECDLYAYEDILKFCAKLFNFSNMAGYSTYQEFYLDFKNFNFL